MARRAFRDDVEERASTRRAARARRPGVPGLALGGGAERRPRTVRACAAPRPPRGLGRHRRRADAWRALHGSRPSAGARPRERSSGCYARARAALRRARRRHAFRRRGHAARSPRCSRRSRACRHRRKLLWAASASGDYPAYIGPGCSSEPASGRQTAAGAAVPRDRRPRRRGSTARASSRCRGGSRSCRASSRRRSLMRRSCGPSSPAAGMTREDVVVALGGGVVGRPRRLLRRDLSARRPLRPGSDDARRPGRLRVRRQDRRRPGRGEELRGRLPPALGGDRATPACWGAAAARSSPPGYAEVVKTALIAGGELWERVRGRRRALATSR